MASFNLGRIKGEKGEAGSSGERGAQGERGVQGAQGVSGYTPVFSIKEIITVEDNENARVEIDSSNIKNPLLTFFIPKGEKGKDALGDMISSIYDSNEKKCDVFQYADSLFDNAMKKNGGEFTGKVKAYSVDEEELCVRNIAVAPSFPEDARIGDVFISTKKESSITLGEQETGTKLIVMENGVETPYIIVDKNYTGNGMVALLRNEILPEEVCFDRAGKTEYALSTADLFLESIYVSFLGKNLLNKIVKIDVKSTGKRRVFLPTSVELGEFEYFALNSKRAMVTGGTYSAYWTRGLYSSNNAIINSQGELESVKATEKNGYRPMFVLSGDTLVENAEFNSDHAVKLCEEKNGIYIFDGEKWKECILIDN
ncbi:MAG: collagen-like protein [Clostridia bacterium]|nr:collagen-like protein [Clostridia bacterium]